MAEMLALLPVVRMRLRNASPAITTDPAQKLYQTSCFCHFCSVCSVSWSSMSLCTSNDQIQINCSVPALKRSSEVQMLAGVSLASFATILSVQKGTD